MSANLHNHRINLYLIKMQTKLQEMSYLYLFLLHPHFLHFCWYNERLHSILKWINIAKEINSKLKICIFPVNIQSCNRICGGLFNNVATACVPNTVLYGAVILYSILIYK